MKTDVIRVRVTEEEKDYIEKLSKAYGLTISELIRQVIIYQNIKLGDN